MRDTSFLATGPSLLELVRRANGLQPRDARAWVLHPGMSFGSRATWWSKGGARPTPHEGIDLCFYRDQQGGAHRLRGGAAVPALREGVIVGVIPDFLGRSMIVQHAVLDREGDALCTIYAHTLPAAGVQVGTRVAQGEVAAFVAEVGPKGSGAGPHLHFTVALVPEELDCQRLDWAQIASPEGVTLIDPRPLVGPVEAMSEKAWTGWMD